jgi:peptidoglycan/LPS O-acetylase OafA/YrhL
MMRASWWLLLGSVGVASVATWYPAHGTNNFLGTWYRFLLGVLVFRVLATKANPWPLSLLLASLAAASLVYSDPRGFTAAATAAVILAAGRAGALGRWLNGRTWQFLGRLSYSLYLYHVVLAIPFLAFLWSHLPHTLTCAVLLVPCGVVLAIAFAWVMYTLIELPSMALSRRVRYTRLHQHS